MILAEAKAKLTELGWTEWKSSHDKAAALFFKRYDSPYRCEWNEDKEGMSVCIQVWDWSKYEQHGAINLTSFCVQVRAGANGRAYDLQSYSVTTIEEAINEVATLLRAWATINEVKP